MQKEQRQEMINALIDFLKKNEIDAKMCVLFCATLDQDGRTAIFDCIFPKERNWVCPASIIDLVGELESDIESVMYKEIQLRKPDIKYEDCELQLDAFRNRLKIWF